MTLNLSMPRGEPELKPRITVVGVGGAGCNAVNNMIRAELQGVEFVVCNTDAQSLAISHAERRVQMGSGLTMGLGAGARPDVGRMAAEESLAEIIEHLAGSHMVFVAAGMGGGTGTGAAPIIARAAREQGILTVAVVTKPFQFEGQHRMRLAEQGIEELQRVCDTLIAIPNQNLFRIANERTTFADAFRMADEVLHSGVRGVTDLMVMPGLINLDFADIRTVMSEMGKAMMGTGEADGEHRAVDAANRAISNPLLDDVSLKGARGVLINITGGPDMTLFEVDEAANRIRDEVDPEANIIFGATFDEELTGKIRITVVATGIDAHMMEQPQPSSVINLARAQQMRTAQTASPAATQPAHTAPVAAPITAAGGGMAMRMEAHYPAPAEPAPRGYAAPAPQIARAAPMLAMPTPAAPPPRSAPPAPHWGRLAPAGLAPRGPGMAHHAPQHLEPAPHARVTAPPAHAAPAPAPRHSFIAPRPMEPAYEPQLIRTEPQITNDPIAESLAADAASSAPREARPRGPSLFERFTGTGRARPASTEPAPAPASRPMPQQPATRPSAPEQPRLGGLDPADRAPSSRTEEELLDIPAFLRRQAN
jgi:cell division protein FtsZ